MSRIGGRKTVNLPSAARPGVWGCPPVQHPGRAGGKKDHPLLLKEEQDITRDWGGSEIFTKPPPTAGPTASSPAPQAPHAPGAQAPDRRPGSPSPRPSRAG